MGTNTNENLPANIEDQEQVPAIMNDFDNEINKMIAMAGTIELTEAQQAILYAPVDEELIEIRPDGIVYLPWMEYVSRLRKALGMGWQAVPQGMPKFKGNHIYWGYYLVIQGKFAGYAIGEQEYQPSNRMMSYGDAVEGAKSNALMRLCKGIGIGLELWQKSFTDSWKKKYAESYFDKGKNKTLWIKKEQPSIKKPDQTKIEKQKTEKPKAVEPEGEKPTIDRTGLLNKLVGIANESFANVNSYISDKMLASDPLILELLAGNADAIPIFKRDLYEYLQSVNDVQEATYEQQPE